MSPRALDELVQHCGSWISTRWIDRLALSRDASLYRMIPQAIARPRSYQDMISLLQYCRTSGLHVTFRAGGTSLSGQAVTDGILIDLSRGWDRVEVLEQGARVRVQPGVTGGRVNARLAPYHRKLGPDPASMSAAMMGGIIANNASGMCCGTAHNSYHTVESMVVILADGTRIDTGAPNADEVLTRLRPDIVQGLAELRETIRADDELTALIRRKYRIKNTMGYSLNAFLDEDAPSRLLCKLIVGSEGTLGFVEEAIYRTIDNPRQQHTALFLYPSIQSACATIETWKALGAAAVELMDDASIRSFSMVPHTPDVYRFEKDGPRSGRAALLVEFHGDLPSIPPAATASAVFATPWYGDLPQRSELWHLRKGLMPTVGALRPPGSTMINEDVAVPPEHLASLVGDLQRAFSTHEYHEAVIFGHAKDGNLHFIIYQDFSQASEIERYKRLMQHVAEIVVGRYNGSLKAEHGTGRNMAPFVEQEWGAAAYALMWRLKTIFDPEGILNPDVILSRHHDIHVQHLKPVPVIDASVNECIECGFCEHVCPTRESTTTPRQRIVLQRELLLSHPRHVIDEVRSDQRWHVYDSCAADGICSSACPVGINTGQFVKDHRSRTASTPARLLAGAAATVPRLTDAVTRLGAVALSAASAVVSQELGRPVTNYANTEDVLQADLVLVPACPSRWFGTAADGSSQQEAIERLAQRAGLRMATIADGSWCCGQIYDSKGLTEAAATCRVQSERTLQTLGLQDHQAVFTDVSTCASACKGTMNSPVDVLQRIVASNLVITQRLSHVVLHPGCGLAGLGQTDLLRSVLLRTADRVTIPASASCCGMAGDHGLRHPDIVRQALRQEIDDLRIIDAEDAEHTVDAYVSVNPLCQSALSHHTARPWISVWELLDRATSPAGYGRNT
ncbi:MAG: FAD-binding and (Fe-S)-binding domain-containing protein [Candidatus Kapaibacteriota bacterium]